MEYFRVVGPNDPSLAVVSMRGDEALSYAELDSLTGGAAWQRLTLTAGPGRLVDYPPNSLVGWGVLCSERMRTILAYAAEDCFRWLEVTVVHGTDRHPYYALHPVAFPDVLDETRTIRNKVTGRVIKPVLSRAKARGLELFQPVEDSMSPVCSDSLKRTLERQEITGLEFVKVPSV